MIVDLMRSIAKNTQGKFVPIDMERLSTELDDASLYLVRCVMRPNDEDDPDLVRNTSWHFDHLTDSQSQVALGNAASTQLVYCMLHATQCVPNASDVLATTRYSTVSDGRVSQSTTFLGGGSPR